MGYSVNLVEMLPLFGGPLENGEFRGGGHTGLRAPKLSEVDVGRHIKAPASKTCPFVR
jgi:hypothetical protein